MKREMSDIQTRILAFIETYTRKEGRPPTNREIGAAVQIYSTGHVDYHLTVLAKKGYIQRERKKSRGIRLVRSEEEQPGLRMYGKIAAGQPIDIFTDAQEPLDLGAAHTREYVLEVQGNSMIEDHIFNGDLVLVLPASVAQDGDIIVATHMTGNGGEATLKRFYRERDRIRLQPANSDMNPIYVSAKEWADEWEVQGRVTAVYRSYTK